jgi:glycosyltransferase involved in cell wall biosynthesis
MDTMKILLLEPYCGGSHRAWAEGYAAHGRHDVKLLTLPARFWKWRMQGGALTLAEQARALNVRPDLILASDMLNLPAFLGLTRDFLSGVPTALYCHENQLTYPLPPPLSPPMGGRKGGEQKRDLTYGMINWLSMLAADRVFFNSHHHLKDWFEELPRLLKHFPDHTHVHRIAEVQAKSEVLPVGCDLRRLDPDKSQIANRKSQIPLILWNQRWEYDKAPEVFFRALYALADEGLDFQVALAGKSYRQSAPEFEAARERLEARVVHFGHADETQYKALLRRADVVVSTALHEFFGIAIVEAIYCGCFPVLPHRLSYPEIIPPSYHENCLYEDFEGLLTRLRWTLVYSDQTRALATKLRPAVARFDWSKMGPHYDELLSQILDVWVVEAVSPRRGGSFSTKSATD